MSASTRLLLRTLSSAAALTLGLQIVGLILQYVSQLLAARLCGSQAEFGIMSQSRSWVQVLATLAAWGLPTVALRFIPEYLHANDPKSIGGLLHYGYRKIVWHSLFWITLGAIAILTIRQADWGGWVLALGMLGIPFCATHLLQMQATRSLEKMAWTYVPYFLFQPIVFMLVIAVQWALGLTVQSGWLVTAFVISLITTSLLQAFPLRKYLPNETWEGRASNEQGQSWNQLANSLGISTSAALILRETDVILVGIFADDTAAGIYMAATRIARLCSFALNATGALVGPWISVRHRQGKMRELEQIIQISTLLSTAASVAIGVTLIFLAGPLLQMFGPGFAEGKTIVIVLLVGHMVNAATGPCGQILGLTGNQKIASWIYIGAAVLHLLGNWIGILGWGPIGGAAATSTVLALCNLAMAWVVFQRLHLCVFPGLRVAKDATV